jgi:hypothetical protein
MCGRRGHSTNNAKGISAGAAAGIASSVAPTAAHIALIAADVVMPLQAEVERLLKPSA